MFKFPFLVVALMVLISLATATFIFTPDHLLNVSGGELLASGEGIWFGLFLLWFVLGCPICFGLTMAYGSSLSWKSIICMFKNHTADWDKKNSGWAICLRCKASWVTKSVFEN